jgi:hypothetical protein
MSNSSIIENTVAHKYEIAVPADTIPVSAKPKAMIIAWCIDGLVILVGLPALVFFIALGGVFALIGPWAILMGVLSIRKRLRYQGFIAGVVLLILSIAGLLLPNQTEPWCTFCGVLGLVGELGYLAVTLLDIRKSLQ